MGRWWSGAYRLYIRACEGQALRFLRDMTSTSAVDLEDRFDDMAVEDEM